MIRVRLAVKMMEYMSKYSVKDDYGRNIDEINEILKRNPNIPKNAEWRETYVFTPVSSSSGYYRKVRQYRNLDGAWVNES